MVFPVVLAVGALVLYVLSKPKDKPKEQPKKESKEIKKDSSNDDLEKKRKADNDTFLEVYNNPKSIFKNSKGQKLTGKTLLSRWDKINRKSKQEDMKFRSLSLKEQIIISKKDSVKLVKYLDEWKKQD
jgi:hypothetical protein